MKTVTYFEVGDEVELLADWRDWNKGERAEVSAVHDQLHSNYGITLESLSRPEHKKDFSVLMAYQVKLVTDKKDR